MDQLVSHCQVCHLENARALHSGMWHYQMYCASLWCDSFENARVIACCHWIRMHSSVTASVTACFKFCQKVKRGPWLFSVARQRFQIVWTLSIKKFVGTSHICKNITQSVDVIGSKLHRDVICRFSLHRDVFKVYGRYLS